MTLTDWPDITVEASAVPVSPETVTVTLPPIEVLARRWCEIEPMLERATLRTQCYEPIDLLMMAGTGRAAMWLAMRGDEILAAIVTQVTVFPRRRVMEVLFSGGREMKAWLPLAVAAIDQHAIACGCSHVASSGRPGWKRAWGAYSTGDIIMVRDV